MIVFKEKEQGNNFIKPGEIRLFSRAVSRGIAIGKAVCLTGNSPQFFKTDLTQSQIEDEITRFEKAIFSTHQKLEKIKSTTGIFDTHLLILEDDSLINKIKTNIRKKRVNAEWAVKTEFDDYIRQFQKIPDEHFRERSVDLLDIKEGILKFLNGTEDNSLNLPENSIVVIKTLKPTTLIELAAAKPGAIVTERGGWTSHSFILAREINLPAVTGIKNLFQKIKNGDQIIVDGYSGQVIINPENEILEDYRMAAAQIKEIKVEDLEPAPSTLKTLDGKEIIIRANLDFRTDFSEAERLGAKGIGLFRSEYLFDKFNEYPLEEVQVESYKKIGELVGEGGVNIRTFDLSLEQFENDISDRQPNPALGLRGIRLSLKKPEDFRTQIRAILRASADYKIDIILPMITALSEILTAKDIIRQEKENLEKEKVKFGNPKIGAMIEVPSAVLTIEDIAREVDFINLGTNDLVQYLLAVDRDDESVADWFRTLHPAVLSAVELVLKTAEKFEIPAIVCGEMAGSPFYAPILIGLGAKELSMNVNSIARLRKTISGIAFEEALELVKIVKESRTADEIEEKVRECFKTNWSHLFTPDILPPGKKALP